MSLLWSQNLVLTIWKDDIIIIIFRPTSTKPHAEILKLKNVNGCNDISFGDHSILEGDRIPPVKSHGQALEEELCFPGVLSDNRDAPANLIIKVICNAQDPLKKATNALSGSEKM